MRKNLKLFKSLGVAVLSDLLALEWECQTRHNHNFEPFF